MSDDTPSSETTPEQVLEPLTPRERKFCDLIEAGEKKGAAYSLAFPEVKKTSASVLASGLLKKPSIIAYLNRLETKALGLSQISADRVLLETIRYVYFDTRTLYRSDGSLKTPDEWDQDTAAVACTLIETEEIVTYDGARPKGKTKKRPKSTVIVRRVKRLDKKPYLDLLGKRLALWQSLPSLETLLDLIPDLELRQRARRELATALHHRPDSGGDCSVIHERQFSNPPPSPSGPDPTIPFDELDPGPVASSTPELPPQPASPPVLPPRGENRFVSGEDLGPLFDNG